MVLAYRFRPIFRMPSPEQSGLDRYRAGRHADPDLAAGRRLGAARPVRRHLRLGPVAPVHAVAQRRRASASTDPYFDRDIGFYVFDLPWLHYLVDSVMAFAVVGLLMARAGPLPLRRHPAADPARPAHRRGAGAALGAARPVRAGQGGRLLARPVRPASPTRAGLITGMTYTGAERRAARQEHPDVHRGDLRGAVLPQRVAAHLDAALGRAGAAGAERGADRHDLAGDRAAVPGQPERGRPGARPTSSATSRPRGRRTTCEDIEVEPFSSQLSATGKLGELEQQTSSVPLVDPLVVKRTFEQVQQVRGLLLGGRRPRRRPLRDRRRGPGARARRPRARPVRHQRGRPQLEQPPHRLHPRQRHDRRLRQPAGRERHAGDQRPAVGRGPAGRTRTR